MLIRRNDVPQRIAQSQHDYETRRKEGFALVFFIGGIAIVTLFALIALILNEIWEVVP